jgi:hypothetical protein
VTQPISVRWRYPLTVGAPVVGRETRVLLRHYLAGGLAPGEAELGEVDLTLMAGIRLEA